MGLVHEIYGKGEKRNATSSVEPLPKVTSGRITERGVERAENAYENNFDGGFKTMSSFNGAPTRSKTPLRANSFASYVDERRQQLSKSVLDQSKDKLDPINPIDKGAPQTE